MDTRAKLLQDGDGQAVILPEEFRFEGQDEVWLSRDGDQVILEPIERGWSPEFSSLFGSAPDLEIPPEPAGIDDEPEFD